ncbi:MAG: putative selenate reductase subunit YgfK, partial [Coriobacteriales bacterium]|nr:putative selenate reductase subunit YgfK [Coriobacteriales bacterium]
SITLSTLHGCPREEIERIAHYLLTEKRISTCVKCNPTLLGYQDARRIMDSMGYDYVSFGELHFNEDLQYDDAVGMIGRLKETASGLGLEFGVKITNTFPVDITRGELPGEEMYMSGRSLFALSLTVASRLANAFKGELVISYSGGADAFNLVELLAVGIGPVTVATTVLKPGGYERMRQLAELAEPLLEAGAEATVRPGAIDAERLLETAENVAGIVRHRKEYREGLGAGTTATVPLALTDCGAAPCSQSGCPINQQIPAYLEQVGKGNMERAFAIIANDNVLPSITGTICDHNCQNNCTRLDYDDSLQIRSAKKVASLAAQKDFVAQTKAPQLASDAHVLVIGAGPAGLAAAAYLRRNGVRVTVRESRQQAGGIVSHVIPAFRIDDSEIGLDVALAAAWGVEVQLGADPDFDLGALKGSFDYVVVATGAWKEGRGPLPLDGTTVIDALDFLGRSRASGCTLDLGARVAVIGGGDVAMDCARAAARNAGVEEAVVVYRRTRAQMPAQREEIELALKDGVRVLELCSPDTFVRGLLTCEKMRLGALDASGRRGIEGTGTFEVLSFDTVISAVGAQVDTAAFAAAGLATDARGLAVVNDANESSMSGVYVAGDCKAGPKTVVAAMADAKAIAKDILAKLGIVPDFEDFVPEACRSELIAKKGVLAAAVRPTDLPAGDSPEALKLDTAAQLDSLRCLACDVVCEVCADVCPNRANVVIDCADAAGAARAPLVRRYQILHLDGLCNECGNCGVFCPTSGNPYLDKLTLFATDEDFADSKNKGFLPLDADASRFKARLEDGSVVEAALGDGTLPGAYEAVLASVMSSCRYLLRS